MAFRRGQTVFGLALEFRIADKDRDQGTGIGDHVFGGDLAGTLFVDQLAIGFQALDQCGAEARFVRAAVGRRHRITVGGDEAVAVTKTNRRPRYGPFQRTGLALALYATGENGGDGLDLANTFGQCIGQTAGEVQGGLSRCLVGDAFRRAGPFDLDATEQIGLGAGHAEQARGFERRTGTENLFIRLEADAGAFFLGRADLFNGA